MTSTSRRTGTRGPTVSGPLDHIADDGEILSAGPVLQDEPEDINERFGDDKSESSGKGQWIPPDSSRTRRTKKFGLKTSFTPPQGMQKYIHSPYRLLTRSTGNDAWDYTQKYAEDVPHTEMGPTARLWKVYNEEAAKFDDDMVEDWKDGLDMLLVFVSNLLAYHAFLNIQGCLILSRAHDLCRRDIQEPKSGFWRSQRLTYG